MVPNIDAIMGHKIKTRKHQRHGTQCVIQYPTNRNPAESLQENAITVFGPRLYNSLPKYLRGIDFVKTEKFKFELDKFLELIPEEPKMPNYVAASGSNSILDQLTHLKAQGIYRSGGVPDSAMEQSQLLRNHSKYPSKKARIAQIDFRAAFVTVNHQGILQKLCSVLIGGSVLSILPQFQSNRSHHVMVDGCRSKLVNVVSVV